MISQATEVDLPDILRLQKLAFQEEAEHVGDPNIKPMAQTLDELRNEFATGMILKKVEDGTIIGSIRARMEGNVCLISRLVVHPAYWRKGIGRALVMEIERSHPQAYRFELFTRADHPRNRPFYQGLSYDLVRIERISDTLSFAHLVKRNLSDRSPKTSQGDAKHR
jgi:GNAT superfamily N-acetyltransferase